MSLSNQQLEERMRRRSLRNPASSSTYQTMASTSTGLDQGSRNPSYVANVGFGGFEDAGQDGKATVGPYIGADASTSATNPANIAADLMKSDSRLMRAAEARGMQAANKRGLVNSSMAVGAAQDAVLDEVVPLASQEAQQRFENNRAKQNYGFDSLLSRQGFEQDGALAGDAFGYERDLQRERIEAERGEAALDREFERNFQDKEFDARFKLAGMDADIRRELMQMETDMRTRLAETENRLDSRNISTEAFLTARDQYNQRVTSIMNNPDMSAEEKRDAIAAEQRNLDTDVRAIEDLYSIDLPWTADYVPSGAAAGTRREINNLYREIFGRDGDMTGLNDYEKAVTSGQMRLDDVRRILMDSEEARGIARSQQPTGGLGGSSLSAAQDPDGDARRSVSRWFKRIIGRDIDNAGLDFWSQKLLSGEMTEQQVQTALGQSEEARGLVRYDRNTGQLVPVSGGQNSAPQPAAQPAPRPATQPASQPSPTSPTDYSSELRAAYQQILGRAPDTAGFVFWLRQLQAGSVTMDDVRNNFREAAARG